MTGKDRSETMRAAVYERYGPPEVVRVTEVAKPMPKDDEVLIRVKATTVTSADFRLRSCTVPFGFGLPFRLFAGVTRPRQPILGTELAGDVEAVGRKVTRFRVGDPVFAMGGARMRCHAEFRCVAEDGPIAHKPPSLTYGEAAALSFGGTTALDFLRRGRVQKGDKVLVNGASGGVGTAVVQIAKHFGAEVTGVCSGASLDLVRSIGADAVIDYTQEDFTRRGEVYDVIIDMAGTAPYSRSKSCLKERGRLLLILGDLPALLHGLWVSLTTSKRVVAGPAPERQDDLRALAELAENGALRPIIDRVFPFERIVDAHRYVDTGHKKGNVLLLLDPGAHPELDALG